VDTGVGMPAQSLELIFEKFCQLDATSTRLHGGVGIGLYLVKRFATVLGGDVTVESTYGEGSTFSIDLPAVLPDPEAQPASALATPASDFEGRLVLVIDDDSSQRDLVERFLVRQGFGVRQRATLPDKTSGAHPHQLMMTATPIPRTLNMVLNGDLDKRD